MEKDNTKNKRTLIVFLAIYILIQIIGINNISLWDIDEGRYLIPAKNAIEYGKWIVPEYNGEPRITKPPLVTWIIAISSIILNGGVVKEWTARVPIIFLSIITLLITYITARKKFDEKVATLAVIILASCNIFLYYSRSPITDMTLLTFTVISIYILFIGFEEKNYNCIILSSIPMTLGFLTKGPPGIIVPVMVILCYYLIVKLETDKRTLIYLGISILISTLLSLIWPIKVGIKEFFREVILEENIRRFSSNYSWESSTFYYIPNLLIKYSPWSAFLPIILAKFREEKDKEALFFISWFFTIFIFFSLSVTKRSSYILASYPALSIITAYSIENIKNKNLIELSKKMSIVLSALFILYTTIKLILWESYNYAIISFIIGIVLISILVKSLNKKSFPFILSILFTINYILVYQPLADRSYHSAKICAERIKKVIDTKPTYMHGSERANELYYLDMRELKKYKPGVKGFVITRGQKNLEGEILFCCRYEESELCLFRKE
ncbi:MAG: ArnT family glycosyltransferase [Thermosulfidibacteraceae bacterium]|jgi:4-amino-4-deoxy-L-arabinose transferase-like glycosyltransferase